MQWTGSRPDPAALAQLLVLDKYCASAHKCGVAALMMSGVGAAGLQRASSMVDALLSSWPAGTGYVGLHVRCGGSTLNIDEKAAVSSLLTYDGYSTSLPNALLQYLSELRNR